MLEVGDESAAEQWVLDALAQKKIMGLGHREYKNGDSQVPSTKKIGRRIAAAVGDARWPYLADVVEKTMMHEKGIFPNVDFPCAYTYYMDEYYNSALTRLLSSLVGWWVGRRT